ncbi:MAG: TIGR03936 family radical SAM-associated protein [Evtepia gabavorous]
MSEQRILFAKYGTAKYISHLDLMHTMERAFLRAGIAIRHTTGFHPHPYVSIPLPLPLGFSSQCEIMEFGLVSGSTMEALPAQMNRVLPAGIEILRCYEGGRPFRDLAFVRYEVTLELDGDLAQQGEAAFRSLVDRPSFVVKEKQESQKWFYRGRYYSAHRRGRTDRGAGGPVGSDLTAESPESGFESRGSAPGFSRRISRPPHRLFRMSPAGNFG